MSSSPRPSALASFVHSVYDTFRPESAEQTNLKDLGYKKFVGGLWDEMGKLQFDFLSAQGLKPHHTLCDIGCGSLRAGRYFIPYLERGNYLGMDKHGELIEAGKTKELPAETIAEKNPEFVVSDAFEFSRFSKPPEFSIAQSLFSHLTMQHIGLCLGNLSRFAGSGCRAFTTFFETPIAIPSVMRSHSNRNFYYTRKQMERVGRAFGWEPHYIGDWNHPRRQMMIEYVKL
jgi:hypothetical protein